MKELLIIIGIIVVIVVILAILYNGLIKLKNKVDNGWSQIDVQLQRRYDLIPNLVETVKGYAIHEKETLQNVVEARQVCTSASTVGEKAQADSALTGTLKSLFAVMENYPDLKADQNFRELQHELANTENKISYARQYYNDTVMRFNIAIKVFPKNIMASIMKFTEMEYFKTEGEGSREAIEVKF